MGNSCQNARITSTYSTECYGRNSCQSAEVVADDLDCHAVHSCRGATLNVHGELILDGYESGLDASVSAPRVLVHGYRALSGAIVDSQGDDVMLDMKGHMAGD